MHFQPLAAQRVFLPLAGVVAIVAVLVTLQLVVAPTFDQTSRTPAATGAARAAAAALPTMSGTVTRVELARTSGTRDVVVVRHANGSTARLLLSARTRIVVPHGDRNVVGGPESLAAGGQISFTLADGVAMQDGATISRLTVQGPAPKHTSAA